VVVDPPRARFFARVNSRKDGASRHLKVAFPTISTFRARGSGSHEGRRHFVGSVGAPISVLKPYIEPQDLGPDRARADLGAQGSTLRRACAIGPKDVEVRCGSCVEQGDAADREPMRPATN
jgi:hypothetical protein